MADQLITGTTLIEKESRSAGDVPVGGILEIDETFNSIPVGFKACDGSTITDPLSSYNGSAVPNYNTEYWGASGTAFLEEEAATTLWDRENTEGSMLRDDVSNSIFYLPVNLPHGAIITACQVWGVTGTWSLVKTDLAGVAVTTVMATAAVDTEDTTITEGTIDNSTYGYFIKMVAATSQRIDGAKITYTPRQKFIIRIK